MPARAPSSSWNGIEAMRLLMVEDDALLVSGLRPELQRAGYAVDVADDGPRAEACVRGTDYDLVLLDLGLPGTDGLTLLRRWRSAGRAMGVIVLTARDTWQEKVDVLKAGADDYVCKPFHTQELLARVAAVLKRGGGRPGPLRQGALSLDEDSRSARFSDGRVLPLSAIEYRLLRCFMLHPGEVLPQSRLLEHLYDQDAEHDSNVIEAHVNRLRRKIGAAWIRTRRGQGYLFAQPEP